MVTRKDPTNDAASVTELLHELTCLPLAITQAATYLRRNKVSIAEYPRLLRHTEKSIVELLSEELPDRTPYNGAKKAVATTWMIQRIDSIALAPETTIESFAHLDQKKILRKMDIRLIPMLALLYLLSFLDRGNLGNAKIEGLQENLGMTADQYNWCLTIFFFTYAAFEVPSNLLLNKLRPSRWLPLIMVAWGTVMTLMGIVQNYHGLLIARLFLGVAEADLFPGVAYYLTMCRAFSGLLAFGISKMDGVGGYEGWRWIFILEGIVTVLVAILAFFVLHDFPETASFLTEEERDFVVYRLKYQGPAHGKAAGRQVAQAEEFKWKYVWQAFSDWQIWVNLFVYWGWWSQIVCPFYGISLFLPTIIRTLGYTSSKAQLMTVPIYITAAILAVVFAWISDKVGKRSPFMVGFLLMMLVGFSMALGSSNPKVVYGGAMASNFYRAKDSPRYKLGHSLEIGFICVGILATLIQVAGYRMINQKREKKMAEGGESLCTAEEMSAQGDKSVTFRYMY
ncbi:major facilitator superfamily transporter [Coniochaeta sp. 2T2.1]|nr:major facilitator superfamily transporter [Coniochaeta sp. 2T2.1]